MIIKKGKGSMEGEANVQYEVQESASILLVQSSDIIQSICLYLNHRELIELSGVCKQLRSQVSSHVLEMKDVLLDVWKRESVTGMTDIFNSFPFKWRDLHDLAELNYIRKTLPSLPKPPHVAFTSDAGFPYALPNSPTSLSDVAFRMVLLTSFLTTSMLSTVAPQHINVLPSIDNQTMATIFMGMMMLGLGREAASMTRGRSEGADTKESASLLPIAVSPLEALRCLDMLVEAAHLRQFKRNRRKNNQEGAKWLRVNNQKRLLWGGVDIDAFYMSPIMLDESVDRNITDADIECYNNIPEFGLDEGINNQSRNFDAAVSPPDTSRIISPVLLACQFNRHEALEYLLARSGGGADANTKDSNGWGGGHFTVVNNGAESLRVLIKYKCDLSSESHSGYTPYQMSERMGMQGGEVWRLLRKEGGGWFTKEGVGNFVGRTVEEVLVGLSGGGNGSTNG